MLSLNRHWHKVFRNEVGVIPLRALLSTGIAGDEPILVRDFVHSALYHPKHGYFSQRSQSVGVLERSIKFNQLEGRKAYMNYLDKIYKGSDISWFTPVELFKPWYAHGIAEAIMRTADLSVPLKIYEIGGGSGTCAKGIMDYIMLNAPPRVYNSMTYTSIEISSSLAEIQKETVGAVRTHVPKFKIECRDAVNRSGWDVEQNPCWVIMLEVAKLMLEVFAEMIFVHGFVHGDPHPGNIPVCPEGPGGFSLVLLDHGIYKELDEGFRRDYCQLWKAMILLDSQKILQLGEKFGVRKYSRYFPLIFTGRTINSKSTLGAGMSDEEKINMKHELQSLKMEDISSFMESLPPDFLTLLRTDGLLRSILSKLGAAQQDRLLVYAKYALVGLQWKSAPESDATITVKFSQLKTVWSYLQLQILLDILELLSWCRYKSNSGFCECNITFF